jgi:hypothetical protein
LQTHLEEGILISIIRKWLHDDACLWSQVCRKLIQEDHEFKASLCFVVRFSRKRRGGRRGKGGGEGEEKEREKQGRKERKAGREGCSGRGGQGRRKRKQLLVKCGEDRGRFAVINNNN